MNTPENGTRPESTMSAEDASLTGGGRPERHSNSPSYGSSEARAASIGDRLAERASDRKDEVQTLEMIRQRFGGERALKANRTMLSQFYGNLQVLLDLCPDPTTESEERIHIRLHNILRDHQDAGSLRLGRRKSWQEAYAAEQLLMNVLPEHFIRADLPKRYGEVCAIDPQAKGIYEQLYNKLTTDADGWDLDRARALLVRLLNDTQWAYSQRYQVRRMTHRYYLRLITFFICVSGLFFSTMLFLPMFLRWASADYGWGFAGFIFTLLAGFVGSSFSMLTRQRQVISVRSIEMMALLSSWEMILLRLMVGAGAAAILYFFFEAGILEGALFPSLTDIGYASMTKSPGMQHWQQVPNSHLSLMMVWGFLAGFSEKLVPTMLARVQKQTEDAS